MKKNGYIRHNGYVYSYSVTQNGMMFTGKVTHVCFEFMNYTPLKLLLPIEVTELGSGNIRKSLVKAIHKAPEPIKLPTIMDK